MRIISGLAGGLTIDVPKNVTRPTTDKVRQAIFSMIGGTADDLRVLELFAGSGALGLEALSRGAASVIFVDDHRAVAEVIRGNLTRTKLSGGQVRVGDAMKALADLASTKAGQFDLVFADPPYLHEKAGKNWAQELVSAESLWAVLSAGGSAVIECSASSPLVIDALRWSVIRDRSYGDTRVVWLGRKEAENADA